MTAPTLTEAIYRTVVYFDLFDYAPTLLDIDKWLLRWDGPEAAPTVGRLQELLEADRRIATANGCYFLVGRSELARLRRLKYDFTHDKWRHARPYLWVLAHLPGVRGLWLTNSTAWGNASANSDLDVMVIAAPGRIWTARFFTTALLKLLRQRPEEQDPDRAICLSLYLSATNLNLAPYKIGSDDIHFAFWASQVYPLYDTGLYPEYQYENRWLNEVFANLKWTVPAGRFQIQVGRLGRGWRRLGELVSHERFLRALQQRWLPARLREMANQDNRVVMTDQILKLHTNDNRADRQSQWERRIGAASL
jgi:hypothetical protein